MTDAETLPEFNERCADIWAIVEPWADAQDSAVDCYALVRSFDELVRQRVTDSTSTWIRQYKEVLERNLELVEEANARRECIRRYASGWMPVMQTSSDHTLEEVYGFSEPHWCSKNMYGGAITTHPAPVPMTAAEIRVIKEATDG